MTPQKLHRPYRQPLAKPAAYCTGHVLGRALLGVLLGLVLLALAASAGYQWARHSAPTHASTPQPSKPQAAAERRVLYWYDPMKPDQKFDRPGKSPFMDMDLVPRYAEAEAQDAPTQRDQAKLAISTQAEQSLGLRLAPVQQQNWASVVLASGTVEFSERDISVVQARSNGFVERAYGHAAGDIVAAGTPLVDVLNPDWAAAQQEFLSVRALGDAELTQAARQRLHLQGLAPALIQQLEKTGKIQASHTITAPSSGVLSELMVRPGMTLSPGMSLARITGLRTMWLELAVPEAQASQISLGQSVEAQFTALPGTTVRGRVHAVLPETQRDTRTLRVRVELPNPEHKLRAGMLAQARVQGPSMEVLTVPVDAVVRTGQKAWVYLAEGAGHYRPVSVSLGREQEGHMEITAGLRAGQNVVASGLFLLDSEANLRGLTASAPSPESKPEPSPNQAQYQGRGVLRGIQSDSLLMQHEAIPELEWGAMTMPITRSPTLQLQGLKVGDRVRFTLEKQGDDFVLVALRADQTPPATSAHRHGEQP